MKKNKEILGAVMLGAGLYLFTQANKAPTPPKYQNVPTAPPKNTMAYLAWVKLIIDQFGKISDLWKPGGPFYKEPIPQYDAGSQFWQDVEGLAGIGQLNLKSGRPQAIGSIGKQFDEGSPDIRPGGRVDRYWSRHKAQIIKAIESSGVDARAGAEFWDPVAVKQRFNLHSIEFGNWMNQADRIKFLYATAVTMRDMARVLRLPQTSMGMSHYLALAFGARGNGGHAAAFYLPLPYHLINLTLPHGRGCFVHEWGHAVDFYLGVPSGGRSHRMDIQIVADKNSPGYLFERAIGAVLWNKDGSPSVYQKWIKVQGSSFDYYARRTEIWARMCERYFFARFRAAGIKNTWGVDGSMRADIPSEDLVKRASPYMNRIFKLLS